MSQDKKTEHLGTMFENKTTARIVGVLFIAATVFSIASVFFVSPFDAPDFLVQVAENEVLVKQGMLVQFIWGISVASIPVFLHPILKKTNEAMSLGFLMLRFMEGVFTMVGIVCQLAVVSLSKNYVVGAANAVSLMSSSSALLAVRDWSFWMGPSITFGLSAVFLNYLFLKSELVPRWLAGWGLIGGCLYLPAEFLSLFGYTQFMVLAAPIALQEMALAVWLISKGFNTGEAPVISKNNGDVPQ